MAYSKKSKEDFKGGIDIISPSCISGWVFSKSLNFNEVRLILNQNLIASTKINEVRKDVSKLMDSECSPGFSINLSPINKNLIKDNNNKISIVAISIDGQHCRDLKFIENPKSTLNELEKLLKSDLLGLDGHFDGINQDDLLHGWAARPNQTKAAQIWLRSENNEAIKISCNQLHGGLTNSKFDANSGFILDSNYLENSWIDQKVWFTFDEAGEYKIPQIDLIKIPKRNLNINNQDKTSNELINDKPSHFSEKYKNIEILNYELDLVNSSLKNLSTLEKNYSKKSFFNKIKSLFNKK